MIQALAGDGYPDPDLVVNRLFDIIATALECDEAVHIQNFGVFETRHHKGIASGNGRVNPRTRQPVAVTGKIAIGFRPSQTLKDRVNEP